MEKTGQTMALRLTEQRHEAAARRGLTKALRRPGVPEQSTLEGREAKVAAIRRDNREHGTALMIRPVTELNTSLAQEPRGGTRVPRPMVGFKACEAAQDPLVGIARMHMIKQRQMRVEAGDEGLTGTALFYALAASSSRRPGQLTSNRLHTKRAIPAWP